MSCRGNRCITDYRSLPAKSTGLRTGLTGIACWRLKSYKIPCIYWGLLARPPRLERGTLCLEGRCSIQLSYGRNQLIYSTLLRQFALHTMLLAMLKSWCEAKGMSRERSASCWRNPAEAGKRRRMSLSQHIIEGLHCHNLCGQATSKEVSDSASKRLMPEFRMGALQTISRQSGVTKARFVR